MEALIRARSYQYGASIKLKLISISIDKTKGPGWVNVETSGLENHESQLYVVIERKGHAEQYLSETGWRVSEIKVHVDCTKLENGHTILILRPNIVQYLDVGNNYQFSILDQSFNQLGLFDANWKGIPHFSLRREKEPILGLSNLPEESKVSEPFTPSNSSSITDNAISSSGTELGPTMEADGNNLSNKIVEPQLLNQFNIFNTPNINFKTGDSNLPLINESISTKAVSRVKIKCSNLRCNLEIYNTMTKCPYCGKIQLTE